NDQVTAPHGLAGAQERAPAGNRAARAVSRCPSCKQHFTSDARFCPFDGGALEPAPGYRADADPLLGCLVEGRYKVEEVLGEGGMGIVYGVRHRSLGKQFAMKVMRADMAKDAELAERFIQEARAAAAVGHPNIVQITDFGALPGGAPYFVMEFLEGIPLSKLLRTGGPPPFARALRLLKQVAAALGAAHAAGVVHRDLKPDNIHVTPNDVVKVLDFGVAKMAGAGRLTRTGMVFGTPHYMSPEQASGAEVDLRADIYALGVIMYEVFAGRVPFEADTYMGVLTKHMFMVPEPPSRVNAAVRQLGALEEVILKCLEKKPEERYASMEALIAEIESIARLGADDSLEIMRPRALSKRPRAHGLADELEPPGREEVGLRRAAGLPAPIPVGVVLGGVALAILTAVIVYAWLCAKPNHVAPPSVVVSPPARADETARMPTAAPPLVATASEPASAPSAAVTSSAAATTPSPSASVDGIAATRSRQQRPGQLRSAPGRTDPAQGSANPPAPTHPSFGAGDIVNPWAK
ncbi:MAG: protein kinase, partial [Polyangiaceae bacterium]